MKRLSNIKSLGLTNLAMPKKKNKYGAVKTEIDGIMFDSAGESKRYLFLKDCLKKGLISNLETHKTYELVPKQTKIVKAVKKLKYRTKEYEKEVTVFRAVSFTPDFVYQYNGETVAEDFKGSKLLVSKDFPLRQKLLYYLHGIYVKVVTKPTDKLGY